jgi:multidrug resistance efflux pump
MSERPTAQELSEAIEGFLAGEILPTLDDPRLRFRMLVALNALGIVRRELTNLPPEDDAEQRELAARIRAGDVPAGTLARVKADAERRLEIANPHFVEQYRDAGTRRGSADP